MRRPLPSGLVCILVAVAFCLLGCDDEDENELHERDFMQAIAIPSVGDSALVLVGTSTLARTSAAVYIDTAPSNDDSLRLEIRVIGATNNPDKAAIVEYSWSADTLRVWCAGYGYLHPKSSALTDKNSPVMEWLEPSRVDIAAPTHVGVRFVGLWYE